MFFRVVVAVDSTALGGVVNSAEVGTPGDGNPANDRSDDATVVVGLPDLALDKRHTGAFVAGRNADWTIVVANRGTAAPGGVITVTGTLPAGVSYAGASGPDWSFAVSGPVVTATNFNSIAPGDSSWFVITVGVEQTAVPAVTNQAVVHTAGDSDPTNDRDADTAAVGGVDLTLDKRHSGTFTVGGSGDYQFVVRNTGTAPTFDQFTVVDTLPAGITFVSGS